MSFQIDLKGKVALVTGVTSGIGLGVAKMLAKAGCMIAGCAEAELHSQGAQAFIAAVEAEGTGVFYQQADLSHPSAPEALVAAVAEKTGGRIDLLVSNAGKNIFKGAAGCDENDWQENMDLNLAAHWRLAKLCKPYLERHQGVIILMSSNHAFASIPGCFPYNVAKTALTGLVRSLAIEWGPAIRTVGIAPGFIETPGNQSWFNSFEHPDQERQRTIDLHPVKRLGTTEELGGWCVFLASEYAAFASGTTYLIDGGRSALMQDGF
ncbi:SDR family NAD(P)-dependent oxidoreductase [Pedobacter sp.]|jgi:NAD(P)-dependent dehydrogenase (short-subunit alcohol dehydrogenase family)|uniref:SDR family NAD(P)-dependent oxidoreductase n=1 Tax=Pedobacter sp. TaxID=1411316 RepID=UPI002C284FE6|nr:SDR family oxidoreductase [Pedobacter sp.]HWW42698.1 SDR family oxidoreductase [Pedobacter sp.]